MKKGFTLVELILYVGIITIVLSALIPFAWSVIGNGVKSGVQEEVNGTARYISERIEFEIRNASGKNSVAANSLSLSEFNAVVDPTVISLSGGNVTLKQGTGSAVNLNPVNTFVSDLTFTNNSSGSGQTINISFTLTVVATGSSRQDFQATSSLKSSAELRSN